MTRILVIPLGLLILLSAAMAWSGGGSEHRADFTFINRGDVGTLDPKAMSWMQDIRIAYALWEGLYQLDPVTLDAVPGMADRIETSPDKKTWTFHIRSDARWSNGDKVTSCDFVFAWKRMLDDPGDYTYLLKVIKNAGPYSDASVAGKDPDFSIVGIHPRDDATLVVILERPVVYFPDLCAFPPMFPLHAKSMEPFKRVDGAGKVTYDPAFTRALPLVTNGPYVLTHWEFKKRLRLEANPFYWDRANVKSKIIDQLSSEDALPSLLTYETHGCDWVAEITGEIASELRARGRKDLHVFPSFGTYFYSFNCKPKLPDGSTNPLADVRIRQALTLALDNRPIVRTITRMGEQPADTYIPRGVFKQYPQPDGLGFHPDRARKLLAEAGYPGGRGFPRLSILFNTGAQHGDIAQNIAAQWRESLGIHIDQEGVEIKVFRQRLHGKDYAIARASWYGDYNDPSTFTDKYLSFSDNNDSAWENKEYDAICDAAANETDPGKRMADFAQAERILLNEAPILPVFYYVNTYLFRDNVKGIPLNPRNMLNFKSVQVVK